MDSNKQAILAILFAAVLFTAMGMFVKILTPNLPIMEIVFARNFFGLVWIFGSLFLKPPKQIGGKPFVLALRGLAGGSAMLAYFYNMSIMPLGTAYAFSYTSPIFLALFSALFIHDKVSLKTWIAILLGFSGILFISNPKGTDLTFLGLCIGLYSGIGAALAYLSITKLAKLYDARIIVLSLMSVGVLLPLLTQITPNADVLILKPFVMPNFKELLLILALGIVSTYAQIYLTKAYTLGNPPIIGAISYSTILFATLVGILLGDKVPNTFVILGMLLITLGGILAVIHKRT